jgi:cell fate (sporulation/competence/biofilm development) regulator YlbF (YheA/YmcA/DUF963 family)
MRAGICRDSTPTADGDDMLEQPEKDTDRRERITEKAEELGRLISQTAEYRYLQAANRELSDDRDATELINRARDLQERALAHLERGERPPEDVREQLDEVRGEIQGKSRYQSLVAAQANFDKLMDRVNSAIGRGMKKGEESRIILPS